MPRVGKKNGFIICNRLSKKYSKFFHNPYWIVGFKQSSYSRDLTFLCVADIGHSHEVIARFCYHETLPKFMEQTLP